MASRGRGAADPPRHPFPQPDSDKVIDFGVEGPRDLRGRAQNVNVYEAVAHHVAKLRKRRMVLASYTTGARGAWPACSRIMASRA